MAFINMLKGLISDTVSRTPRIDASTHALEVIQYAHHEVHGGSMYSVSLIDADLDNGDEINICFKTPAGTKLLHMIVISDNTSGSIFSFLEAPTVTLDSGSQLVALNRRRDSIKTATLESIETTPTVGSVTITGTISADGTVLNSENIGSGKEKIGGGSRSIEEWILAPSTIYAARLVGTADNGKPNIQLHWYEHTDKG